MFAKRPCTAETRPVCSLPVNINVNSTDLLGSNIPVIPNLPDILRAETRTEPPGRHIRERGKRFLRFLIHWLALAAIQIALHYGAIILSFLVKFSLLALFLVWLVVLLGFTSFFFMRWKRPEESNMRYVVRRFIFSFVSMLIVYALGAFIVILQLPHFE